MAEREAKEAELTKKEDTRTKPKIEPQVSTSQDTPKPLEQANKPEKSNRNILAQALGARRQHMNWDDEDEQKENKSKSVKPGKLQDVNTPKFAAVANLFKKNVSIPQNQEERKSIAPIDTPNSSKRSSQSFNR